MEDEKMLQAIEVLGKATEVIEGLKAAGKREEFKTLTGLDGDMPPLIMAAITVRRDVSPDEIPSKVGGAFFDALFVGAALGFAHGKTTGSNETVQGLHDAREAFEETGECFYSAFPDGKSDE